MSRAKKYKRYSPEFKRESLIPPILGEAVYSLGIYYQCRVCLYRDSGNVIPSCSFITLITEQWIERSIRII